jgi:hypothetical protein
MTVQQEHATAVRLPEQRQGDEEAREAVPHLAADPELHGWPSAEDRNIARWMAIGMLALGLYGMLFVWLGTRVIG